MKAYNADSHYETHLYLARRWIKRWGDLFCSQITQEMVQEYLLERRKVSAFTANKDLRYLRSTFNYGLKKKFIKINPANEIDFFPVEKKIKHIPCKEEIDKVIEVADSNTQDYLWTIRETMARVSEINRLTWDDVNFKEQYVILYTRKKKGGNLSPRKVPMTKKLFELLYERYSKRDKTKPWVFWHTFSSSKSGEKKEGPYTNRKRIMKSLCKKAGVKYFTFHFLRHAGASIMDNNNVPIGAIQRILGHEKRSTTEIYLHSIGQTERDAILVYERVRENSHTNSHTENKSVNQ